MALLQPFSSSTILTEGVPQEVYACPSNKSHAIVNINFFKTQVTGDALIEIGLSTSSNPSTLTSVDYFIDDIELIGNVNSAELNKVIVGRGEKLYVRVVSGPDIAARVEGMEENNPSVLKAGRLAAVSVAGTNQTTLHTSDEQNASYTSASITVYNADPEYDSNMKMWITSKPVPTAEDQVFGTILTPEDTIIMENINLLPGEKIVVESSTANSEWFVNGIVVRTV